MKIPLTLLLLFTTVFMGAAGGAKAANGYMCLADMTTGFTFDKNEKRWRQANFNPEEKYLVTKVFKEDLIVYKEAETWVVRLVGGDSVPVSVCPKGFNDFGQLHCEGSISLRMNRNLLRFIASSFLGYWTYSDLAPEGYFLPNMSIGNCSPL